MSGKRRKMFISTLPGESVEVVVAEESKVREYYVEMHHQAKTKGNIYKGYVHNVDANLQAAFINYGAERNGFLQIDEIHPDYYQGAYTLAKGQRFPPIQKIMKAGQEVLVQVVKEPTGKKGAFMTTYLSLAGRFFVLPPGRDHVGVSRKIEGDEERAKLKEVVDSLKLEPGLGVIVRTACHEETKASLSKDLNFLKRLWKELRKKGATEKAPSLVHQEVDLASRAVRDYLTTDVMEIWVDDPTVQSQVAQMLTVVAPRRGSLLKLHTDTDKSLFERFNLQRQIEEIYGREVELPSGGRLVIDSTEALTAIDINSGKIGGKKSFKDMAFKTNMEAAEEIALQLRLRDIGGQFVVDFIEMKDPKHIREVEKTLKTAVKPDRARIDIGRISRFGLLEMVRQRLGSSALSISTEPCPCCNGTGSRRNLEFQALQALKEMHRLLRRDSSQPLLYECGKELALYLLNTKRAKLAQFEADFGCPVQIAPRNGDKAAGAA